MCVSVCVSVRWICTGVGVSLLEVKCWGQGEEEEEEEAEKEAGVV